MVDFNPPCAGRCEVRRTLRRAFARLRDRDVVTKLFNELGPRYQDRPGGYVRILKCGFRAGDSAPMAIVELVDRPEVEEEAVVGEEVLAGVPAVREPALTSDEVGEPLPALDTDFVAPSASIESPTAAKKPQLRFAEDILARGPTKPQAKIKKKKKKKGFQGEESEEGEGTGTRKLRRAPEISADDADDEEY